jgi:UDP-N-acetylglucosamine 2-epimerase (non-hydrolysing)
MKKIGIIIGTRPETIKLLPVYFALKKNTECFPILISTGQHKEMMDQVLELFEVRPDHELELMTAGQSLEELSIRVMKELSPLLKSIALDLLVVQGDTTSAFTAALSAYYQQIPIAHVEAGLRTGDKYAPFPEEGNRKLITAISDLNFAPTEAAHRSLLKEGVRHSENVGNTVIDSILQCKSLVDDRLNIYKEKFADLLKAEGKLVGITAHRRENFGEGLKSICSALRRLADLHPDHLFVFPVHLNPEVKGKVYAELGGIKNMILLGPLSYDEWVFIMSQCILILTDSGGIQEEAPALDVPVVVMRDKTERPEGIDCGAAVLSGTSEEAIIAISSELLGDEDQRKLMQNAENPYGDGQSSGRIVDSILRFLEY